MIVDLVLDGVPVSLPWDEFEERVRAGRVPPDTPARFEPVTGAAFVPIRTLELYQELVHSDHAAFQRRLRSRSLPLVTALLVGLQVRVFLWGRVPGGDEWLVEHFANWGPAVLELGQVHRLLTYGLLHLGVTHLAFNVLFLAYAGWSLERAMGRRNLALLWLGSVFCGGLVSMAMAPERPSLGASGGDFGLIAAAVVVGWKYGDLIPESSRRYYGWAILVYLVVGFSSGLTSPGVDNWGHLGGLLGGGLLATLLHPDVLRRHLPRTRRIRRGMAGAVVAALGALSLAGPDLVPLARWTERDLVASRPAAWGEGWTFTGDRGAFSPTGASTLVAASAVHPGPVDLDEAGRRFLQQAAGDGGPARVLLEEDLALGGWPARRYRLEFTLSRQPYVMEALLVARGCTLYRFHQHTRGEDAPRYRRLWDRMSAGLRWTESPGPECPEAYRRGGG